MERLPAVLYNRAMEKVIQEDLHGNTFHPAQPQLAIRIWPCFGVQTRSRISRRKTACHGSDGWAWRRHQVVDQTGLGKFRPLGLERAGEVAENGLSGTVGAIPVVCIDKTAELNEAAYLPSSSFGNTSATSPNFVFSGSVASIPTMRNCSGFPARSS
jgi:hypothetical protein